MPFTELHGVHLDSWIVHVFHVQVLCLHEHSKLQTIPHSVCDN